MVPSPELCSLPSSALYPSCFPEAPPGAGHIHASVGPDTQKGRQSFMSPQESFSEQQDHPHPPLGGPEHRQWKMPSDLEPGDPVVPPTKLCNCGHASPSVHAMVKDGSLDPREGSGSRQRWTDVIYVSEAESLGLAGDWIWEVREKERLGIRWTPRLSFWEYVVPFAERS